MFYVFYKNAKKEFNFMETVDLLIPNLTFEIKKIYNHLFILYPINNAGYCVQCGTLGFPVAVHIYYTRHHTV
jgi:hypothetical protein